MSDPNRPSPHGSAALPPDDHAPYRRPSGSDGADHTAEHTAGHTARRPLGHGTATGLASDVTATSSGATMPANSSSGARPAAAASAPTAAQRAPRVTVARRGPRRARLVVKHIDPWTVMKVTFIVSLVVLVVVVIASAIIYAVLAKMGVWDQVNSLSNSIAPTTASPALHNPLTATRLVGVVAVVGAINVVLLTALATLGAAIYNLISDLVGGIEVTLSDP